MVNKQTDLFIDNNPWRIAGVTGSIIPADRFLTHAQLVSTARRVRTRHPQREGQGGVQYG